jgi:hypothetical protein
MQGVGSVLVSRLALSFFDIVLVCLVLHVFRVCGKGVNPRYRQGSHVAMKGPRDVVAFWSRNLSPRESDS